MCFIFFHRGRWSGLARHFLLWPRDPMLLGSSLPEAKHPHAPREDLPGAARRRRGRFSDSEASKHDVPAEYRGLALLTKRKMNRMNREGEVHLRWVLPSYPGPMLTPVFKTVRQVAQCPGLGCVHPLRFTLFGLFGGGSTVTPGDRGVTPLEETLCPKRLVAAAAAHVAVRVKGCGATVKLQKGAARLGRRRESWTGGGGGILGGRCPWQWVLLGRSKRLLGGPRVQVKT